MFWLGTLLNGLFAGIFTALTQYFTKRVAKAGAVFLILLALNAAFISALSLAMSGVMAVAPAEMAIAWGWFMPTNAEECLGAILAIHVARWVYDQNTNFQTSLFR